MTNALIDAPDLMMLLSNGRPNAALLISLLALDPRSFSISSIYFYRSNLSIAVSLIATRRRYFGAATRLAALLSIAFDIDRSNNNSDDDDDDVVPIGPLSAAFASSIVCISLFFFHNS